MLRERLLYSDRDSRLLPLKPPPLISLTVDCELLDQSTVVHRGVDNIKALAAEDIDYQEAILPEHVDEGKLLIRTIVGMELLNRCVIGGRTASHV